MNEVSIRTSLQINNLKLSYQSRPTGFTGSQATAKGPVPGAITVSTVGTDINLGQLAQPGYVRIANLDPTSTIEYGIMDHVTHTFYPVHEILPGESYVARFSKNMGKEYGTGPGTAGTGTGTTLRVRSSPQPAVVLIEAFEN